MTGYKNKTKRSTKFAWMHVLLMGIVSIALLVAVVEGGLKSVGGKSSRHTLILAPF